MPPGDACPEVTPLGKDLLKDASDSLPESNEEMMGMILDSSSIIQHPAHPVA